MLTKKSFQLVAPSLPELANQGFQSDSLEHDHLVTALHLGEALLDPDPPLAFLSEQELKSLDPSNYPEWAPKNDGHRPDGYWRTLSTDRPQTIALEVELSRKTESRYRDTARHYEFRREVDQVLWIVGNPQMARKILTLAEKYPRCHGKYQFALVGDIATSGWNSRIFLGSSKGNSIQQLLGYSDGTEAVPVPWLGFHELTKSPHKSGRYSALKKRDVRYCYRMLPDFTPNIIHSPNKGVLIDQKDPKSIQTT